jgi:CheY-like chemotaxis protein
MQPVRVLCVDDDPLHRKLLEHHLRGIADLSCSVEFVATESGAWDAFRRQLPDTVLVDFQLAEGDGLSLIRRIRAIDSLVPIIAISGVAPAEVAEELVLSGADDYLDKRDLDGSGLARSLRSALRRADAFRQRLPAHDMEGEALTGSVREFYSFLTTLGTDALLNHLESIEMAARLAGGIDRVTKVFESVCREPGLSANVARRVLQPYLLEIVAVLSTATDATR